MPQPAPARALRGDPRLSHATERNLLVLHTLRCIGAVEIGRLVEASGLDSSDVESELIDLAIDGFVRFHAGAFSGWRITDDGRAADATRIAADLDVAGARSVVARCYDDFAPLNTELLELCSAWQLRPAEVDVVAGLGDLHARADDVLVPLATALDRLARYRHRLVGALDRVGAGELDYVATDLESYHTVWFQLHEDLLVTLGIPRH